MEAAASDGSHRDRTVATPTPDPAYGFPLCKTIFRHTKSQSRSGRADGLLGDRFLTGQGRYALQNPQ